MVFASSHLETFNIHQEPTSENHPNPTPSWSFGSLNSNSTKTWTARWQTATTLTAWGPKTIIAWLAGRPLHAPASVLEDRLVEITESMEIHQQILNIPDFVSFLSGDSQKSYKYLWNPPKFRIWSIGIPQPLKKQNQAPKKQLLLRLQHCMALLQSGDLRFSQRTENEGLTLKFTSNPFWGDKWTCFSFWMIKHVRDRYAATKNKGPSKLQVYIYIYYIIYIYI